MTLSTHSQRLERWLGAAEVTQMSGNFRSWYGPPVPVGGVPGRVFVTGDGDFIGECRAGSEVSGVERAIETFQRAQRMRFQRALRKQRGSFTSLSALITAATGGKQCRMNFQKVGTAPTAIGGAIDLWGVGNQPAAGAAGAAAAAGTAPTSASTGAMGFVNAVANANTSHFVNAWVNANFVNSLLLCDRLFAVAKTMSSSATEAVTGTLTRYTNASATAADYIGGNFCYPRVSGVLSATAHNWTVCQYCVDEATECLTRRQGWTNFRTLRDDDEILAFDPETQTTRWERIGGVFVNERYQGDMLSLGEKEFNAFTTPDHRWPVRRYHDGLIEVQRSESLRDTGHFIRFAPHEGPKKEQYSDAFVELCAWYFTEGSIHGPHSIRIAQSEVSNAEYVSDIRRSIAEVGARTKDKKQQGFLMLGRPRGTRCDGLYVSEHRDADGMVAFTFSGTDVDLFRKVISGPNKVPTAEFLCTLTARQARLFVETCQKGDGTPEKRMFFQHHPDRMSAYMMAAVLAGLGPNLSADGTACSLRQQHTIVGRVPSARLYYEGPIWCPITESGHWVARRYGKTSITGNTNQAGTTAQSFPSATGVSAGAANQIDIAVGPGSWFMPLASGDVGVKALTQMQCSSASVTGTLDFVVAHAIAVIPVPIVNIAMNVDGVASAFNLVTVLDNACLYFIELPKPATNATTYSGIVATVSE